MAGKGGVRVRVRSNRIGEVKAKLPDLVDVAIQKFIMDVIALADPDTPVDTGHLKSNKVIDIGHLKAVLVWAASYALYVHEGTRFMPARWRSLRC